eukprot:CAMPEP_0117511342 /NCGR_PEP_ID=MMETSP0784-20121206/28459_1 /TAXON_ID=39447 /ORGANISM="" /LENGTH=217 /DNA_ID=CAMNT_0005307013 /DNA_START=21 /DNA_END=674 /DNA_ORIENTATION=-
MGLGSSRRLREVQTERDALQVQLAEARRQIEERDAEMKKMKEQVQPAFGTMAFSGDISEEIMPMATQLSLGATLGYAAGYTLKVAGRMAAVAVGTGFIMLQGLSYMDYVHVDWRKIQRDYEGKVDQGDLVRKSLEVLAFNLPAGTGFTGGLLYGLGAQASSAAMGTAALGAGAKAIAPRAALAAGASATSLPAGMVYLREKLGLGPKTAPAEPVPTE